MSLSIQAVKNSSGGSFSSDAIVPPEGTREKGTFWSIGPTILFKGESGIAGILEKNKLRTQIQNLIYRLIPSSNFFSQTNLCSV